MQKVLNDILLLEPGGEIRIGDGAPGINFETFERPPTFRGRFWRSESAERLVTKL